MTDAELLNLCGLPPDVPEDVVELVRLTAVLVEPSGEGPAGAAVALASAMGVGGWSVQSYWFGHSRPPLVLEGWIKRVDLAANLAQVGGMIVGQRFDASSANMAIDHALSNYWLRKDEFDSWQPGMASGSGWRTVVQVQPLGIARARELAAAPVKAPQPRQAAPPPAPTPAAKAEGENLGGVDGPKKDPQDPGAARYLGKRIWLGEDTQVSRLFWLLAKPIGRAVQLYEVQREVDVVETARDGDREEVRKAGQRLRRVVSKLRRALRDAGIDDDLVIVKDGPQTEPQYSMVLRSRT